MTYVPKTDEEIKQLALDTYKGMIFFGSMIPPSQESMLGMVFMPILFLEPEQFRELEELKAVPYEYYDKAGPRGINGFPCFMSMHFVSNEDYERMRKQLAKIKEVMSALTPGEKDDQGKNAGTEG